MPGFPILIRERWLIPSSRGPQSGRGDPVFVDSAGMPDRRIVLAMTAFDLDGWRIEGGRP
jgi:hypothetical protein